MDRRFDLSRSLIHFRAEKTDVDGELAGGNLRQAGFAGLCLQADQLCAAAAQHELKHATRRLLMLGPPRGAQQAQDNGQPVADRHHGPDPAADVLLTQGRLAMPPVVVGRQVELADATGNRDAVLDRHQPFAFAQIVADLAMHGEQQRAGLFDFVERAGEGILGNFGIVAEGQQYLALALEFLHQVEFQVGAAGDLENLEHRDKRHMVLHGTFRGSEMRDLVKQIFEPQQRANALAERVFVCDHTPAKWRKCRDKIL